MSDDGGTFRLLQPSLMSIEELREIMSQRGIRRKGFENKTKLELVELYEQQLLPLSQRKFPNTHLGQKLNKKIAEETHKKSKNEPKASEFQYGFKGKSCGSSSTSGIRRHSSSQNLNNSDRLKPPVDSSSLSPKKICLSRRSSSDKSLEKIVINDRSTKSTDSHNEKSDRKSSNETSIKKSDKKSTVVKVDTSPHKESTKEDKDEPKEKRRRIAWP